MEPKPDVFLEQVAEELGVSPEFLKVCRANGVSVDQARAVLVELGDTAQIAIVAQRLVAEWRGKRRPDEFQSMMRELERLLDA